MAESLRRKQMASKKIVIEIPGDTALALGVLSRASRSTFGNVVVCVLRLATEAKQVRRFLKSCLMLRGRTVVAEPEKLEKSDYGVASSTRN
jgi:hypothetical protein